MRPASIVTFERLYLLTLAIGVVQIALGWEQMLRMASLGFVLSVQIGTLALLLLLILLVSRRGSRIAKWLLVGLFVLGLPVFYKLVTSGAAPGSLAISVVQTVLQAAGLLCLFTRQAKDWLAAR